MKKTAGAILGGGLLGLVLLIGGARLLSEAGAGPAGVSEIRMTFDEDTIVLWHRTQIIGRYEHSAKLTKPHMAGLWTSSGHRLTRGYPMEKDVAGESKDHPHHRGAWFCHGDVIADQWQPPVKIPHVEGVDFWSEGMGRGKIICVWRGQPRQWDKGIGIATKNEWRAPNEQVILLETRHLGLTLAMDGLFLVWEIELASPSGSVRFGDTKEGSLAVRVNDRFNEKNGGMLRTATGEGEKAVWGQQTTWCDYQGFLDGQWVGLTIFDDPKNPTRACWHSRGYGLHAANPFGRHQSGFPARKDQKDVVELKEGDSLKLRYAMLLHEESLSVQQLNQAAMTWINLPKMSDWPKD